MMSLTAFRAALCGAGFAAVLAFAGPALAQSSTPGFALDTSKPIEITADSLEVLQQEKRAIFAGKVDVVQGDIRLRTERLRVAYSGDPQTDGGEITELRAEGGVIVTSGREKATGATALYDVASRTIRMTGDVVLTQDETVIRGQELVIDLATGRSKLSGGSEGGRVRSIFKVPERSGGNQ
ncbi:MAG: lipopolysaccharide transport periplasmic protein LptA [Alphaproteobacteria bacterium]|nr:lipopolysaccharide transport periplasmic protein LptA [Alphaproteobacteria bacterium]MDX5369439.1 lipopolysaccharide transport periplasmic protein LptA [Alphaproteobacteria bacterium]MDX5464119.1 lipopolysaccharide transport periplasmic protein LptA [Alphaproteobacteria bacterium]